VDVALSSFGRKTLSTLLWNSVLCWFVWGFICESSERSSSCTNSFPCVWPGIRSWYWCIAALGLQTKQAPKWKAASARPRNLHLDTQQALKSRVAPLWKDTDDEPDNANNDTQSFTTDDFAKGNKVVIQHLMKSTLRSR
jgi:hypothetical protein